MRTLLAFALAGGAALAAADVSSLEGGKPLPAGTHTFTFPNMAKQSISFISDADERIVGTVAFDGSWELGSLTIDADKGTGSGSAMVPISSMKTGNTDRDGHMMSEGWLDAKKNPSISFSDVSFKRVSDTVYEVTGTWTVKGVSKELTSHANVRFIPKFPRVGENLVRVRTSFDLPLKDFGVTNPSVGSPAVAAVWTAEITLLGVKK
jgi:polyisoprenoid-binding protein YceI